MKWGLRIVVCALAGVCAARLCAQGQPAQPASPEWVCPLSDNQFKKAQEIFAKIAEVMRNLRCINCHGAEDPFAKNTHHSGGTYDVVKDEDGNADDEKTFGECQNCHTDFKGWATPPSAIFFVGLDNTGLCMLLKTIAPKNLIAHFQNDEGGLQFIAEGFKGTRGGAGDKPEPIVGITQAQLTQLVRDWIAALGSGNGTIGDGDRKRASDCGCVQHHYAVRMHYTGKWNVGTVLKDMLTVGPVDIPITFHDDRSFEGEKTLPWSEGLVGFPLCVAQTQAQLNIKASGKVLEDPNQMRLELTNVTPVTGSTTAKCINPLYGGIITEVRGFERGHKTTVSLTLKGLVGEEKDASLPPLVPGGVGTMHVTVVDLGAQPANPK